MPSQSFDTTSLEAEQATTNGLLESLTGTVTGLRVLVLFSGGLLIFFMAMTAFRSRKV